MATTKDAMFDYGAVRTEMAQILEQAKQTREANKDVLRVSRMLDGLADQITKDELHVFDQVDGGTREDLTELLRSVAETLNPLATVQWKESDIERGILTLKFGLLDGAFEDSDAVNQLIIDLTKATAKAATPTGPRAPRTGGDILEGRPSFVQVTINGVKLSLQKANGRSSVGNVKSAVITWMANKQGVTVSEEEKGAIGEVVRQSIEDNKPFVELGNMTIEHATK